PQDLARRVLSVEDRILKRFEPLLTRRITSLRMRTHGDYHLGQVLYTGKDFVVIDLDGGGDRSLPERRRKRSPLRDVAGMVRSLHSAAFTAMLDDSIVRDTDRAVAEPWALTWTAWAQASFLRGYLEATQGAAFVPADPDQLGLLLDTFVLAQALHEL